MTNVEKLDLRLLCIPKRSACDIFVESLVTNKSQNDSLKNIELYRTGANRDDYILSVGYHDNVNFSRAASVKITSLRKNGVEITEKEKDKVTSDKT